MKKVFFLLAFFAGLSLTSVNAQCSKGATAGTPSCCAGKAAKAASSDATIEKRSDDNGIVSYVRKETDAEGNVKFVSVKFDEGTNTFVNEAPKSVATVATEEDVVKKTATTEKKACCAGKKACGAGAAKTSCSDKKAEQ